MDACSFKKGELKAGVFAFKLEMTASRSTRPAGYKADKIQDSDPGGCLFKETHYSGKMLSMDQDQFIE